MTKEERKKLAKKPIVWQGDLADNCTALWAGLMLHVEWMDENYWWWAVYDMQKGKLSVDSSSEHEDNYLSGDAARKMAETVARKYLGEI